MKDTLVGHYYIGAQRVRVLVGTLHSDTVLCGLFESDSMTIRINAQQDRMQVGSTFLHELTHVCHLVSSTGRHTDDDEGCARNIEVGFGALLTDPRNAPLLRWLTKCLKGKNNA